MLVHGTLIHAPEPGAVEIINGAYVTVGSDGTIVDVSDRAESAPAGADVIELTANQFLLPGLVDLHVHAPQWPQMGKALHLPLNDWLQQYTFPLEAKYADLEFARVAYDSLVDNLLANGTTTATYFGTVHLEATRLLADIAIEKGQRAIIGKVAMDNVAECPDYYRDATTELGLADTRAFIEYIQGAGSDLVHPAVTPRFIPSCTDEMLDGLGRLAAEYNCHIQTHCSESDWEHQYVIDRHGINDTQSLDKFGLLTDRTVLAHGNLVSEEDIETIWVRHSGIAHCPLSNVYLSHSVFPVRKALDRGLKIGLGTDIAGGASPSILHNCEMAISAARALEDGVDPSLPAGDRGVPGSRIDYREAFWLATAGGGKALGLNVGLFRAGFAFDAIVIDTAVADANLQMWEELDTPDDVLQKIIYNADRRNIVRTWVQGRDVTRD